MTPPTHTSLRQAQGERAEAPSFAMRRLWSIIDVEADSPAGRAVADALLRPAREMLDRGGKRFRGQLLDLCWRLGGGQGRCHDALPAVIEVIHAGSLIVDDIEDDSPERRGEPTVHRLFGMPLALNAGNYLYFWAQQLLRELALPPAVELELHRRLGRMLICGHAGQALDLGADLTALDQDDVPERVAATSRLKTGSFMGLAAAVGAVAAEAEDEIVDAVERFGLALGDVLQMLDDLGNLVGRREGAKRYEDLLHRRATWPWAWYAEVASRDEWNESQRRLAEIGAGAESPDDLGVILMERVGLLGRQRVNRLLSGAFEDLRGTTGPHPLLTKVRAEMDRLEKSYV